MKILSTVKSAVLLATLSLPSIAAAGPGSVANLKLALTTTIEQPGTFLKGDEGANTLNGGGERIPAHYTSYTTDAGSTTKTEEMTTVITMRYGVREVLEDLLSRGYFPQGETSIRGYSLKSVSDGAAMQTFLYKKGLTPVNVDSQCQVKFLIGATKRNLTTEVRREAPMGPVESTSAKGSAANQGKMTVTTRTSNLLGTVTLEGKATGTIKYKYPSDSEAVAVMRTVKSTSLSGQGNSGGDNYFVEGSLSTGPAVMLDNVSASFPGFLAD